MSKKYKGLAKIELINVKTGEVQTQIEENIVTNAIPNFLTVNPFGAIDWKEQANIVKYLSGIVLFDKNITENVNNTMMPFTPRAWAGSDINSGLDLRRGSINNAECKITDTGCQLSWEWNTTQGNGTYKCIGLTNPNICNADKFGDVNLTTLAGGPHSEIYFIYPDAPDVFSKIEGSAVIYDHVKGYFYKPVVSIDGKTITITRAYRPCYKIPVGQVNIWNSDEYKVNKALAGEIAKDVRTVTKTVETSLTYGQTAYTSVNMISVSYYNGIIYLFSLKSGTSTVIITKIDVTGEFTESAINITQQTVNFAGATYRSMAASSTLNGTQIKDSVCFNYPYLYLSNSNNLYTLYKCNINDPTDVTELEYSNSTVLINNTREGIILGNFYINKVGYRISLSEDSVVTQTNVIGDKSNYSAINTIGNAFVRYNRYVSNIVNNSRGSYIAINPYYIATINNVTPFTKTTDHTLKITYTITEVE